MACDPCGTQAKAAPATTSTTTHQVLTIAELRSPMTTPVISISIAPHASTSSGSSGANSSKVVAWFMRRLLGRQRGSLDRGNGVVVVFEQLRNRSRGYVEDRLWHDTKQNG